MQYNKKQIKSKFYQRYIKNKGYVRFKNYTKEKSKNGKS